MDHKKDALFQNFSKTSRSEWIEKATADLRGADPIEKFSWIIDEDIVVNPYYDSSDVTDLKSSMYQNRLIEVDNSSQKGRVWHNIQEILVTDEKAANSKALESLISGADGVHFLLNDVVDMELLLEDMQPESCRISFATTTENANRMLFDLAKAYDLNGFLVVTDGSVEEKLQALTNWKGPDTLRLLGINASAAKYPTQQLADQLFEFNLILDMGTSLGLSLNSLLNSIHITCHVSTDYFLEICKLRALRNLTFQIARAYGADKFEPEDLFVRGVSPPWINDVYEPYGNLLKSSTAAMAAILGGCNELIVQANANEEDFSQRIARNVSLVLKEEAHLDKSADPVAGAYYLEVLTDKIAARAWAKFQEKIQKQVINET